VEVGEELACVSVRGEFDVPLFTLNAPDRMGFRSKMAGNVGFGLEKLLMFTKDGRVATIQKSILDSREMRTLIALHPFREGEAMHFYRNAINLYARNEDITVDFIGMVSAVADVITVCGAERKKHIEA